MGYYIFDYTTKITSTNEFLTFLEKIKQKKYQKCIFCIDAENVDKRVADILIGSNCLDSFKYCFYYNKDNFSYLLKTIDINKKLFIENLLNIDDGLFECKVCFEKFANIFTCSKCYFHICKDCIYKSHSVINKSVLDCKCLICKNNMCGIIRTNEY